MILEKLKNWVLISLEYIIDNENFKIEKKLNNFKINVEEKFYIFVTNSPTIINVKTGDDNYAITDSDTTTINYYESISPCDLDHLTKNNKFVNVDDNISVIEIDFKCIRNDIKKLMFFVNSNMNNNFFYIHNNIMYECFHNMGDIRLPIFYKHRNKWKIDSKTCKIENLNSDITNYLKEGIFINK